MIAHEQLVEAQDADNAVAQVETDTTWREALLARLRPADHRISDEEIFSMLNDGGDGRSIAELCAASGVTVPMYCVWKSKYRQLGLDELRQARRREQRRRYTVIGLVVLAATLSLGGIVVGISWAVLSAIAGSTAPQPAPIAVASDVAPGRMFVPAQPRVVARPAAASVAIDPPPPPAADPAVEESGYRIQVTAADTEQQGRALVARLVSAGYPAYTTRAVVGSKEVFRVRVGPFETQPEAEKMAAQLRSAGYTGAWIAR